MKRQAHDFEEHPPSRKARFEDVPAGTWVFIPFSEDGYKTPPHESDDDSIKEIDHWDRPKAPKTPTTPKKQIPKVPYPTPRKEKVAETWMDAYRFYRFNQRLRNIHKGIPDTVTLSPTLQENMFCFNSLKLDTDDLRATLSNPDKFTYSGCLRCGRGAHSKALPQTVCPLTRELHVVYETCYRLTPKFRGAHTARVTFFNSTVMCMLGGSKNKDFKTWSKEFMERIHDTEFIDELVRQLDKMEFTVWCCRSKDALKGAKSDITEEKEVELRLLELSALKVERTLV